MKRPATRNPLNWHCFRFALGHYFFQHPLSPYDEKCAQDVAKLLFPEWKNKLLPPQPLHVLCLWPHLHPKNSKIKLKNCFQTNHQFPLALPTECYKLVTIISKAHPHPFQRSKGISHTTLRLATPSPTTHLQRTRYGQNRPSILQRHIFQWQPR